ncbi:hypothetical protein MA16_Dca002176 [Dendrobium catenatum]|uniref:Uncharacterized protein n=1 Tax=Dendrobium catenatum TaxID=906689 RepID=A0A2I0V9Z9_9ASPA|nr:hypothetical protein MA16_Dca014841 [Dendrobium catenatum]PKU60230.1 hypothetical protein MA16_Dca025813 [Dendrobium catenatum]PKU82303.1 hypothetical protein MA16_Dca019574 [Dendrobium catenatum]PKU86345.1 hypothetical protein MA16_Dca002176 [Dendrobium catenatum]
MRDRTARIQGAPEPRDLIRAVDRNQWLRFRLQPPLLPEAVNLLRRDPIDPAGELRQNFTGRIRGVETFNPTVEIRWGEGFLQRPRLENGWRYDFERDAEAFRRSSLEAMEGTVWELEGRCWEIEEALGNRSKTLGSSGEPWGAPPYSASSRELGRPGLKWRRSRIDAKWKGAPFQRAREPQAGEPQPLEGFRSGGTTGACSPLVPTAAGHGLGRIDQGRPMGTCWSQLWSQIGLGKLGSIWWLGWARTCLV